jgi:hypothetical protein
MKIKILLMMTVSALAIFFAGGCTASFSTSKDNTTAAKPPQSTTAVTTDANKSSNTTAAVKSDKPKGEVVKDEKKPEGTAKTANKDVPVPADWVYFYDDVKGYGFSIPKGTTSENADSNGIDVTALTTPSGIDIFTLAYKDKTLTKDDLLKDAVTFLEGLGQKVTPGALKDAGDYYAVADATTVLEDGRKGKLRILVGTDVTDNYVMILGTDTDKFAANEKIIDEIWGSFEMWSVK